MFSGKAIPYFIENAGDWLLALVVVVVNAAAGVVIFGVLALDGFAVLLEVVAPVTATAEKFCELPTPL